MFFFKLKSEYFFGFFTLLVLLCSFCTAEVAAQAAEPVTLNFLYTSDVHGHVFEEKNSIGLAKIAAYKKTLPNVMLLDAGDFLHGTPFATFSKGKDVVAVMKAAGYGAATLGNHDFDYGLEVLLERNQEALVGENKLVFLSANIVDDLTGNSLVSPWILRELDGVKVAVMGLTTVSTKEMSLPSFKGQLLFSPVGATAALEYTLLAEKNCDIILALTHLGHAEGEGVPSLALASDVPELDAIIDGHGHALFSKEKPGFKGSVFSPDANAQYLGKLTIQYDKSTRSIVSYKNTFLTAADLAFVTPDPQVEQLIAEAKARLEKSLSAMVGRSRVALPFVDKKTVRSTETALGNFGADALRFVAKSDLALLNAGSFLEGLPKGPVTVKEMQSCLPFNNDIQVVTLTGQEIIAVLEHGYSFLPEPDGRFLLVSGLTVYVAPAEASGKRVQKVLLGNGKPLDLKARYTVAVNSFMVNGGDGFTMLADKAITEVGVTDAQALALYFEKADTSLYKKAGNRIVMKSKKR